MSQKKHPYNNQKVFLDLQKQLNSIKASLPSNAILSKLQKIHNMTSQFITIPLTEDMKSFILEVKESETLSQEDFLKRYGREINICKALGRAGWVVSEHSNPREVGEWYNFISKDTSSIVKYFDANDGNTLKHIKEDLSKIYIKSSYCLYYNKGIFAYDNNDYMTAAIYWVALLEARINELMNYPLRTSYSKKFSEQGFENHLRKEFSVKKSFFTKRFLFLNMYPSLIEYLNKMFIDGEYTFESKNEPPYINRNWLLHGRCSREIERFECVQIINALSVIEFVFGTKNTN